MHGMFRISRNPMYLGMMLMLVAWSFCLSSWLALLGPLFFVLYMTYFQIVPEEQRLRFVFGLAYETYLKSVRRWL
jgi:protein-S-isoprenylcysteine O-methyltransferase Ste14